MRLNLEAFIETVFLTTLSVLNSTRHHLAPPTYPDQSFLLLSQSLNLRGTFSLYPRTWIVQFRTAPLDYLSINSILSRHRKTIEVCRGRAQIRQRARRWGPLVGNHVVKSYDSEGISSPFLTYALWHWKQRFSSLFASCKWKKISFNIVTHRVCECLLVTCLKFVRLNLLPETEYEDY